MDPWHSDPEVVIVSGERIAAVGPREILAAWPRAEVRDLAGRKLLPGFIDAHHHLCIAALHPLWADLSAVTTLDQLRHALHAQAAREPRAHWIRGSNWTETGSGFMPDRHDLDAMGLGRPVLDALAPAPSSARSSHFHTATGCGPTLPGRRTPVDRKANAAASRPANEPTWSFSTAARA